LISSKIHIKNLTLSLDQTKPILTNVAIEIPTGQITCLIGPSGSGKSTLLRCLNRLWEPPPDTVFLDGQDITRLDVLILRRRVSMLFQHAALFEGTVAGNVVYGPGLRGQQLPAGRITELLEMAGLQTDLAQKPVGELSVGQAQRVALARTLANEPEVLLLDEPTSALDPTATRHVEESVLHLRAILGLTVVWVSHAIEQVARMADQVVLLVEGRVVEIGTPEQLLSRTIDNTSLTKRFELGEL
jgi:ABC-type methionine transport system ATPase subunit